MDNNTPVSENVIKEPVRKKHINTNKEGIRIVKVAAFCFAIISFIATSEGLASYVFEYRWQAYMISFGIQSILFVFNLKLPYYFEKIGSLVPNDKKKKRKNNKTFRWTFMQKVIACFYVAVIFSSSFFSYVFIVNVAYASTQYLDADITLDSNYRKILDETEDFINEDIKLTQLIAIEKLSELQGKITYDSSEKEKSESDFQTEKLNAQNDFDNKSAAVDTAQRIFDTAKNTYEEPMSSRWRSEEDHNQEYLDYKNASDELEKAIFEKNAADKALKNAINAVDNFKPSASSTVKSFLVEMLKAEPSLEDYEVDGKNVSGLNTYIEILNEYVVQLENEDLSSSDFSDIVSKTEELNISVNNYILLRQAQKFEGANNDINDLKDDIKMNSILVPVYDSDNYNEQIETWKSAWKERMVNLERVIKTIPNFSDLNKDYLNNYNDIVDFKILTAYDAQSISDKVDNLIRDNISSINQIERAKNLLLCDYPFLAVFSLLLAFFFDIASLLAGLFIFYVSKKS